MSVYKRGGIYWYKFQWNGKLIRESTKQGNDKVARQMEAAHRTALAKGEVGLREKKPSPTLKEFLKGDFQKYAGTRHAAKPLTLRYYTQGSAMLLKSELAGLRLDENERFQETIRSGHDMLHSTLTGSRITDLWFQDTLGRRYKVKNSKKNVQLFWRNHSLT